MTRQAVRSAWVAAIAMLASLPGEARAVSCAVGPFILFFDVNSDEIDDKGRATLDAAAPAIQTCGIGGRIFIAGHADRSGSSRENMSLSRRRAERVRAQLAGRGLSGWPTIVEAFGESRPLVETPDGVREGENRRVEIVLGPGPDD